MRTIVAAAILGLLGIGAAIAGTAGTVSTAPDPSAGAGCLAVTVYDMQGNPHVSTWCPPGG